MLQQVRNLTRKLHRSIRTEQAYVYWIEQFLRYHRDRLGHWQHPAEMGSSEVNDFLTHLAVKRNVAASTQNQAFSAHLFLFRNVLEQKISIVALAEKYPETGRSLAWQ